MTVYARSDVAAVTISRDHGGCGTIHSRPVVAGAPARLWSLTCDGGCEDFLRSDSLWSSTPESIPETPDEVAIRSDAERRGTVDQQRSMAQALNDLAKLGDLPTILSRLLNQDGRLAEAVTVEQELQLCRSGHPNQRPIKFCGECGVSMDAAVNSAPVAALSGPESPAHAEPVADNLDLNAMTFKQLQAHAQAIGAELGRTKAEQLTLIEAKNN